MTWTCPDCQKHLDRAPYALPVCPRCYQRRRALCAELRAAQAAIARAIETLVVDLVDERRGPKSVRTYASTPPMLDVVERKGKR